MTIESEKATPVSNDSLAALFHRASKLMSRSYHRHAHAHHAQSHVLSIVKKQGPISQRELLKILDVRSSSLSEVLGKLEQSGLIVRERDDADKRSFIVSVKEDVSSSIAEHGKSPREGVEIFFAGLADDEREQLGDLLKKIIRSAEESDICGHGRKQGKHPGKGEKGKGRNKQQKEGKKHFHGRSDQSSKGHGGEKQ